MATCASRAGSAFSTRRTDQADRHAAHTSTPPAIVPTIASQRGTSGVSSGQISQCVMKIHIDADANQPIGCARIRGTGSVGTQASSTNANTNRASRPP